MRRINGQMLIAALMCTLLVTNTNDDGAGSLRAAIEEANARRGCDIAFQIEGDGLWQTIRPLRPLPPVLYRTTIDATTQRDTNPAGPDVELNGSRVGEGSGLHFCAGTVQGLAINGFAANGITIGDPLCPSPYPRGGTIRGNYIGTDPTGTLAVPNARGIWIDDPRWIYTIKFMWTIEENVISGNRYSGVFVGKGPVLIRGNTIGLSAKRDASLGNGASGVAVLAAGSGTDVDDNAIGFNQHFGIGIAPGGASIGMQGNSFQSNGQLAIDWGFDGASPGGRRDSFTGAPAAPEITSVRRQGGATFIEGSLPPCQGRDTVTLYANDAPDPSGYGEGQYVLGTAAGGAGGFSLVYPHDLRGKWVTATRTCDFYYAVRTQSDHYAESVTSSEFSRAVEVH